MRKEKEEKPLTLLYNGKPDELIDAGQVGALFGVTRGTVLKHWRQLKMPAPLTLGTGPKAENAYPGRAHKDDGAAMRARFQEMFAGAELKQPADRWPDELPWRFTI